MFPQQESMCEVPRSDLIEVHQVQISSSEMSCGRFTSSSLSSVGWL